jgi:hypothetical protein
MPSSQSKAGPHKRGIQAGRHVAKDLSMRMYCRVYKRVSIPSLPCQTARSTPDSSRRLHSRCPKRAPPRTQGSAAQLSHPAKLATCYIREGCIGSSSQNCQRVAPATSHTARGKLNNHLSGHEPIQRQYCQNMKVFQWPHRKLSTSFPSQGGSFFLFFLANPLLGVLQSAHPPPERLNFLLELERPELATDATLMAANAIALILSLTPGSNIWQARNRENNQLRTRTIIPQHTTS